MSVCMSCLYVCYAVVHVRVRACVHVCMRALCVCVCGYLICLMVAGIMVVLEKKLKGENRLNMECIYNTPRHNRAKGQSIDPTHCFFSSLSFIFVAFYNVRKHEQTFQSGVTCGTEKNNKTLFDRTVRALRVLLLMQPMTGCMKLRERQCNFAGASLLLAFPVKHDYKWSECRGLT